MKDSLAAAKMRVFAVGTIEEAKVMASSWAIDILVANVRLSDGPGDAVAAEVGRLHPGLTTIYVFDGGPPPAGLQPACPASDPAALVELIDSRYERQPSSVRTFA